MTTIKDRLDQIQSNIRAASEASGRTQDAVTLIAVSKGKSDIDVRRALDQGQRVFGENRVQEAKGKFLEFRATYPGLELHLIGPLQTNKAADALEIFDVIETLDRPKLAETLAKAAQKKGKKPHCYIEINIAKEPQKAGIAPNELEEFLHYCRSSCDLTVTGLMCIPPQVGDPSISFAAMKQLADQNKLPHLSMGMSIDYEAAIRCGATHVRVGTAIFGAR